MRALEALHPDELLQLIASRVESVTGCFYLDDDRPLKVVVLSGIDRLRVALDELEIRIREGEIETQESH